MTPLSPTGIFAGRAILMLGGTGFLGKVCLGLLLDRFPDIGRIYLMVRARSAADSEDRFRQSIVPSPALDPLRRRYGPALDRLLREKVVVVNGDIREDHLGFPEDLAARIAGEIDVLINCSGRVTFNPPLESALTTNVTGTLNTLAFAKRMRRPALVHVSTCFVAGNRSGEIWENEPVIDYFPRRSDPTAPSFSVDRELRDCERLVARVRDEADDAMLASKFLEAALARFREEGRDPDHERTLRMAIARERKNWVRQRLTRLGIERAQWWGWPNIYTYTKSLGEQLVARETGIVRSIVRPSIVESALAFPFPGWNEGFTTTAPLSQLALKGQNVFPVREDVILDVIPVDHVAAAVLAVAAQACVEEPALVYQASSGDLNPSRLGRLVALLGLYKRKHFENKPDGPALLNALAARMEAQAVSPEFFEKFSLPMFHHAAAAVSRFLEGKRPHGLGPLDHLFDQIEQAVGELKDFAGEGEAHYKIFRPFIVENNYIFRADNTRALFARLPEADRGKLTFSPETIDWYSYWLDVHLPGLQRWVFPKLDEARSAAPRRVHAHATLLELFDACTKLHAGRVAMRIERNGRQESYTYGDLRECALRAAAYLAARGVARSDRVGLIGENAPEWGMTYFGILKAGATCVPLEKDASTAEIAAQLDAAGAAGLVMSPALRQKHAGLEAKLEALGRAVRVWTFADVFVLGDEAEEQARIAALPAEVRPDALASIIFTSGTTGRPKGVMLTHRNFTSLVAKLVSVYEIGPQDGMLSILPLHHSFEFTTGFLLPLTHGARITYLEEVTGDAISRTLKTGTVTCIVGVPALWDLLQRKILSQMSQHSEKLGHLFEALIDGNYLLREETPFSLGPLLFAPVHQALGGRIRYLISGGAALSENTLKTFRGLGFNLNEGYGLTEAAPVLTVTRPNAPVRPGSVGQPLPGIDIRIDHPDRRGIGEVIARGPNITPGYWEDEEATREVIADGWLHTGDLGRLDADGYLYIVGRLKDVIVDSNGKNVYPDEIESLYVKPDLIRELAVVGLPDGSAERVACLVVPDYAAHPSATAAEMRDRVEAHFHEVSAKLPFFKRVKTLRISTEDLPRTATRKVRRREVVKLLQRLKDEAPAHPAAEAPDVRAGGGEVQWLLDMVAELSGRSAAAVTLDSRFEELRFDSLMYTELAAGLEAAGEHVSLETLTSLTDVRELAEQIGRRHAAALPLSERRTAARTHADREEETPALSPAFVHAARKALSAGQVWLYNDLLDADIQGRANIPTHTHFIAAANHASHLDMGLVKIALGEAGRNLVALAAADYFFDNKVKRLFIENFTNLVPLERKGSLRKSLKWAFHLLEQGYNVLVFPEGTRSRSGRIQPFQRGVGHLALRTRVGILPVYLSTHGALPPGAWYLKSRAVSAHIGPFLSFDLLERLSAGLPASEAERVVTALVQDMVEDLSNGVRPDPERRVAELRRQVKGHDPVPGSVVSSS